MVVPNQNFARCRSKKLFGKFDILFSQFFLEIVVYWQLFPLLQVVIIDNIFANCFMEVVRSSYFDADFSKWRSGQFFWQLVVYMVKSLNHQSIENSWYVMCTIYTDTKTYMLERSSILLTQNLKRKQLLTVKKWWDIHLEFEIYIFYILDFWEAVRDSEQTLETNSYQITRF